MCDDEFGETLHLKDLGRSQRTYGTCGNIPSWNSSLLSPTHGGFREWEAHEVKSNETMVGIALKYDITVEDIRRCNNLWTNDALWPGQVLRIPVKSPTNFLSPPMVSSDQDETGSSRSNQPHSFSGASRNDSHGELSGNHTRTSNSRITSSNSHNSSISSTANPNSSRRNTKSSISSNPHSSSSDIAEGHDECPDSSQGGHFSSRQKGEHSASLRNRAPPHSASEVTATEFLSRMDMSIEATRKNMKKVSPTDAACEKMSYSSVVNDPSSTYTSGKSSSSDRNRSMC